MYNGSVKRQRKVTGFDLESAVSTVESALEHWKHLTAKTAWWLPHKRYVAIATKPTTQAGVHHIPTFRLFNIAWGRAHVQTKSRIINPFFWTKHLAAMPHLSAVQVVVLYLFAYCILCIHWIATFTCGALGQLFFMRRPAFALCVTPLRQTPSVLDYPLSRLWEEKIQREGKRRTKLILVITFDPPTSNTVLPCC